MIDRVQSFTDQNQVAVHDEEIGMIMDEMSKGVDVTTIGPKALTADKMRILSGGLSSPFINLSTVVAGTWSEPGYITVGTPFGIGEGLTNYLHTAYWDVYVDGVTTQAPYTAQLAQGAVFVGAGGGGISGKDKFVFKWYPVISQITNPLVTYGKNTLIAFVFQIKNDDSADHTYNVNFFITLLGTQLTGGS